MKNLIVIPARYKSSRLPGKPLKKILNKELILWVLDACKKIISKSTKIIVATDNKKILKFVKEKNFKSLMTSKNCLTGTDRVAEISRKINAETYINVQGDEPLIKFKILQRFYKQKKDIQIM